MSLFPFGDESDEGDEGTDSSESKDIEKNKSFQQLRKHARSLEKQVKEWEPELQELREFRENQLKAQREQSVAEKFATLGLNPGHSKLYTALNPEGDVTPETIGKFVKEYGLGEVKTEVETMGASGSEGSGSGFTPLTVGGDAVGSKRYSFEDFMKLAASNPEEAKRVKKAGRVDYPESPWRT